MNLVDTPADPALPATPRSEPQERCPHHGLSHPTDTVQHTSAVLPPVVWARVGHTRWEQYVVDINLAVIQGPLSAEPELRTLPSGSEVANLAVRASAGEHTTSVPVSVWDPPAWLAELATGDEVIVLGAVRRRFYRAGGGTGSRVDVEATFVGRPGKRQIGTVARRMEATLAELTGGGG